MIALEKIILLNQLPLFAPLHTDEIRQIAEITEEDYRNAGELLYAKGDDAGRLYILISGVIELNKATKKQFIRQQILGETTLFSASVQKNDAYCVEDSEFLIIERDDMETLIYQTPAIAIGLLKVFSSK